MSSREPRNPFYLLLLVVGMVFVLTVLAYALVPVLEQKARDAGAVRMVDGAAFGIDHPSSGGGRCRRLVRVGFGGAHGASARSAACRSVRRTV